MSILNVHFLRPTSVLLLKYVRNEGTVAKSIKYCEFGDPPNVLQMVTDELDEPKGNEVLVKILAAPVNPSDINTIQGKYPVKITFPAVGGSECVARVIRTGDDVIQLCPGQHVVPVTFGLGTWTTYAIFSEDDLLPVSDKIGIAEAATMIINPCTAYRMLQDFVKLAPGDCVIQNGANSAVGQAVHQLCHIWGLQSVGVVRDRPDICALEKHLKKLGATEILTEEEVRTSKIFKEGRVAKPKLALNCVGGESATEITRHLANKGVMVTYGGMSRKPVTAAIVPLIFKDISFRGFWITRWLTQNLDSPAYKDMIVELSKLMLEKQFVAPIHEMVPLKKFNEATTSTLNLKGFLGKKYIFNMECT